MNSRSAPEVSAALASFAAEFPGEAIPEVALEQVPRALIDLAGVTVIGYTEPTGQLMRAYVAGQSAVGPCTLLGGGARLAASMAALANGTAGHAFDFDDIGVRAGHVSVAMMPAALAIAEMSGSSGREFAEAMVVGYEIAGRLTRLYEDSIDGPYAQGFHKPSVYAVFGGTAAACRLLALDAVRIQHAFGIAASQSGGLRVNFGTMTKPMHAGVANRTAVEAALLARDGFTASTQSIEGRFGWYDAICHGTGDLDAIVAGLGSDFAIEEGLRFKNYPSCGANHCAIDIVLELLDENDLGADDVISVDVAVDPRNLEEVLIYPWPRSGLEGKFCLAYNVAAALVDRAVTVHTFADDQIPRLEHVRSRIRTGTDGMVHRDGARVTVHTTDGRTLTRVKDAARGTVGSPLTWDDLVHKFEGNVRALLPDLVISRAVDGIAGLLTAGSVAHLTELLEGRSATAH